MALNVCALVSGGKDSCMAMMKCVAAGHRLVALANLMPLADSSLDTDSWCFQTAGHNIIDNYSRVVMGGLPLYRRRLRGTAHCTTMDYAGAAGQGAFDEVEDLFLLLRRVKRHHPELSAVCSGAILSSYQRLRVEHVCARLGLVSLAPLWQRNQRDLLDEMLADGLHAVLIKVASLGLGAPQLGKALEELRPLLHVLEAKHGVSVCGEGGEYESLTLDCPLFSHSLVPGDTSVHALGSGAALLQVSSVRLLSKPPDALCEAPDARVIMCDDDDDDGDSGGIVAAASVVPVVTSEATVHVVRHECAPYAHVRAVIVAGNYGALALALFNDSAEYAALFVCIRCDIAQFAELNAAYGSVVAARASFPPARAVWQPHASSETVEAEVVLVRKGIAAVPRSLHVQSVSPWAPACIGPYSQLVAYADVVWLSGMIPLDAATMTMSHAHESLRLQLSLCITHCSAVLRSMGLPDCAMSIVLATIFVAVSAKDDESSLEMLRTHVQAALPQALVVMVSCAALPRGAPVELQCVASNEAKQWRHGTAGAVQCIQGPHLAFAVGPAAAWTALPMLGSAEQLYAHDYGAIREACFVTPARPRAASAQDSSAEGDDSD